MKIIYIGPIASPDLPAAGGFESANRKNIDMLKKLGVKVVEYPYPTINRNWGFIGKLAYLKLLLVPFRLLRYMGVHDVAIHITPLWKNLLWPSYIIIAFARLLGIPVLVDVRAGSLVSLCATKPLVWKRGVSRVLCWASAITAEGKSYMKDIPATFKPHIPVTYFPNTTYCVGKYFKQKPTGTVNLVYFGRITKDKGVDLILEMMKMLDDRFHLFLAGNIQGDMTKEDLEANNITYFGSLKPIELDELLDNMHVFVFPTRWMGEGQSNSLIEAMQKGLIPIVSDQGFNRDVVADCGVVLPQGSTAADYREALLAVVGKGLDEQGRRAHEHIIQYHNIDVWIPWLIEQYKKIVK